MRRRTRELHVGNVGLGGGARVSVQTMGNCDAHDAAAILGQIERAAALGCDIFRLTVPDMEAARVFGEVRRSSPVPLVADIHFDYRLALAALFEHVTDRVVFIAILLVAPYVSRQGLIRAF